MDTNQNYYELLEITEDASPEVIKAAYKALVKKYHPDSVKDNTKMNKKIEDINVAYEVLSDEKKRNQYDSQLRNNKQNRNYENASKDTQHTKSSENFEPKQRYYNTKDKSSEEEFEDKKENDLNNDRSARWGSKIGKFFNAIGKEVGKGLQENARIIENAYIEGTTMDKYTLVRCFKKASGFERLGYARALEEVGLLEKSDNGGYKATSSFKYYE